MHLSAETQKDMLSRMRRIEGQARGVQRMIADDRDCLDILTQLASLRSAAYSVSVALTQHYAVRCVREAGEQGGAVNQDAVVGSEQGSSDDAIQNLVNVLLRAPH
jgi:DNA-binding FrmR family transcriptional regulator